LEKQPGIVTGILSRATMQVMELYRPEIYFTVNVDTTITKQLSCEKILTQTLTCRARWL